MILASTVLASLDYLTCCIYNFDIIVVSFSHLMMNRNAMWSITLYLAPNKITQASLVIATWLGFSFYLGIDFGPSLDPGSSLSEKIVRDPVAK